LFRVHCAVLKVRAESRLEIVAYLASEAVQRELVPPEGRFIKNRSLRTQQRA